VFWALLFPSFPRLVIFVNWLVLLLKCSIFDSGNTDFGDSKIPSTMEIKTKAEGWETTSRGQDGSIWLISQRERTFFSRNLKGELLSVNNRSKIYTLCTVCT
jgi:hypothetical protein